MLTAKQRQFLRGLAHALSPVVRVGRSGLTPAVVDETKKSLLAHELIKVRIDADEGEDAENDAAQAADRSEKRGFQQELRADVAAARADGPSDADLSRPFGDRHQHDVHDSDSADDERDRGDARQQDREGAAGLLLRL